MSTAVTVTGPYIAEFHNIGTPDPSWTRPTDVCSTVPIAPSGVSWPNNKDIIGQQVDNCRPWNELWVPECDPGGEKIDELYSARASPTTADIIGYHSPARQCPESWETAGVIAMNNGTPSATGIFSPTVFTYFSEQTETFPVENFLANMFTSVLAPTETAVACCPSGYTADPFAGCYSQFPLTQLANKTACHYVYAGEASEPPTLDQDVYTYTFEFFGTTTTAEAYAATIPADWNLSDNFNTSTQTIGPSGVPTGFLYGFNVSAADVTGVAQRQPIWLVHSGEESEDGEEAGGDSSETPSAGRAVAPNTAWTAVIGVMAAWGVGMAAGVGLLAAW
ncbi:hypothetical protein B0T11DRAFT_49597 [Plectosphaerella cucumerina]|uniref:Uncharacterized protein n=1 Tax=Plectosphaerella cucumerina TaxID=40658 RepID=A0A8K0TK00_9PEZI|nr:hypothetical protein B0T11DRAFT_49597 [Plectosphaerella cucumerina]